MGYAKIIGGGTDGRYTIELDFGAAQRTAALAQLAAAANQLAIKHASTTAEIAAKEALIVPMRAAHAAAVDAYVAAAETLRLTGALPPGTPQLDTKAIDFQAALIQRAELALGPLRRQLDAIKFTQVGVQRDIARWTSIVAVSTRQAWCTTLKENAPAGSYVATCDIPGDSNLILLAPECRAWIPGDGKITPGKQADALASLNAQMTKVQTSLAAVDAAIVAGDAAIAALKAQLATVTAAYAADPISTPQSVVSAAALELSDKQREVVALRLKRGPLNLRVAKGQQMVARYTGYQTTATPTAGDGYLRARGVMSPEQSFFNVAILPGWQKFKPTYRWGTATAIDYDADTMDVSLFDQKSDAQGLSINQTSSLASVPVVYMTCNADTFKVGDRVVVEFQGQDWKKPRVIGFLDNPKPCGGWSLTSVTVHDGGGPTGSDWARIWEFTAVDPVFVASLDRSNLIYEYRVDRGPWLSFAYDWSDHVDSHFVSGAAHEHIVPVPAGHYGPFDGLSYSIGTMSPGATGYLTDRSTGGRFYIHQPDMTGPNWRFEVYVYVTFPHAPSESSIQNMPAGAILEFRVSKPNGDIAVNVAVKNATAPTYYARTRAKIIPSYAAPLSYELFQDNGT